MATYYVESIGQRGNFHPVGFEPCTFSSRRAAQAHVAEHKAGLFQRNGGHVEMGRIETTTAGVAYRVPLYRWVEYPDGGRSIAAEELRDTALMNRVAAESAEV